MSIPMNTYQLMLDVYKKFILDLMKPTSVATLYSEFTPMTWLKNMVTKDVILNYLGSTDNTIYSTNLYDPVSKQWDKSITENAKMFYEELINKYIEQVSLVYNTNLSKITL